MKRINPRFYMLFSGLLTGICVVLPQIGFLAYFSMIPAFLAFLSKAKNEGYKKKKSAYLDGFIFFMSYYVVVFHWFVYLYPLSFTGMSEAAALAVVIVAVFGLSALQASVGALNFLWLSFFSKGKIYKKYPVAIAFFGASLWAVLEWTQTLTWAGIPWGRLVLSQAEYTVNLQTVSLFGSYFITFLIAAVNFLFAYAIFDRRHIRLCPIVACSMVIANLAAGTVLYFMPEKSGEPIKSAALQGNMLSGDKWADNSTDNCINIYSELIRESAKDGAELIVLPETAIPTYILESGFYSEYYEVFSELSKETGAVLVVGAFSFEGDGEDKNSLMVFYPDGNADLDAYVKQKLVPFGEFVPYRALVTTLIPPLADINMLSSDLYRGDESSVFELGDGKAGALICFDSIYEQVTLESVRNGAQLIVMSTNDSWFYDSRAVYMHNYQAKLRAIETGRYIVRSGNTGISSIISSKGDIIDEQAPLTFGYALEDVRMSESRTLYSYIGNSFVYLLILADIAVAVYAITEKRKQNVIL